MITTKQEFINALPLFYEHFQIPIFLLSENLTIISSTQSFMQVEKDYFQTVTSPSHINQYKIYFHFDNAGFLFFPYTVEDIHYICLGPFYSYKITVHDHPSDYPFLKHVISSYTLEDFLNLPYFSSHTSQHILFIYQMITGCMLDKEELRTSFKGSINDPLKQEKTLDKEIFQIRENPLHEFSYQYEKKIMNYIQNENSTQARLLMNEMIQIKDERKLSKNELQSLKYKVVAAITLFTRVVIDVGVPIAKAYTLSDVYIIKTDQCQLGHELKKIVSDAIVDFTQLVKRYKHVQNPYWIKKCKSYISHNLHQQITLDDIADIVEMNPRYISTQFKKLTGISIKQYINEKKIKEAQFLIKNSDYTLVEISEILQYSNQSHFNKVFKEVTGLTPIQYKNSN